MQITKILGDAVAAVKIFSQPFPVLSFVIVFPCWHAVEYLFIRLSLLLISIFLIPMVDEQRVHWSLML